MKSPGHQKWPDHQIKESDAAARVEVEVGGEIIADSRDVVVLEEEGNPTRYYLPRSDVKMEKLSRTETTSTCPFKGEAHYFSLRVGSQTFTDAVWTYEDPYDEHRSLLDRLAFYEEKIPGIEIRVARREE